MCSFASLWSYGRLCVSRPLDQGYLPLLSPALPRPSIHPQVVQSFPLRAKVRTRVRVSDGAGRLINDSHQQNNRLISVSRTITQSPPRTVPVPTAGEISPHGSPGPSLEVLSLACCSTKSHSTREEQEHRGQPRGSNYCMGLPVRAVGCETKPGEYVVGMNDTPGRKRRSCSGSQRHVTAAIGSVPGEMGRAAVVVHVVRYELLRTQPYRRAKHGGVRAQCLHKARAGSTLDPVVDKV
jgi:hypothetical protein